MEGAGGSRGPQVYDSKKCIGGESMMGVYANTLDFKSDRVSPITLSISVVRVKQSKMVIG